jgi:hypothetical protein
VATRRTSIRPAERLLAPSVAESLRQLPETPEDAGARRLAAEYAAVIDESAWLADLALSVLDTLEPGEVYAAKAIDALQAAVEHRKALVDLGPKLLAALSAVGATAEGRAKGKGAPVAGPKSGPPSALEALRGGYAG